MAEDLQQERIRLANRMREQLWRDYPQTLEVTDDLAYDWSLTLWHLVRRQPRRRGCARAVSPCVLKDPSRASP